MHCRKMRVSSDPGSVPLDADCFGQLIKHFVHLTSQAFAPGNGEETRRLVYGSTAGHWWYILICTVHNSISQRAIVRSQESMSWSAALHRSAAPHPPEFARSAPTTKPTKHELFAALVSGLDEVTPDASWKRTFLTEAVAVAASDAAVLRSSSALDGKVQ